MAADGDDWLMSKKDNPFSAYAIVSQVGFMVIVPLLFFIWGGSWLIEKFSLPGWLMIIFVLLGVITMVSSVGTYLYKIIRMYDGKDNAKRVSKLHHDSKDHDYYTDE